MPTEEVVKKRFLSFFALVGAAMTASLYRVPGSNWLQAMGVYVTAVLGFSGGNIFYDALITDVASAERMDLVSALGFSLGYLGGGTLFALTVWMVFRPYIFGIANAAEAIRYSFILVGVWWAIFSLPLLLFVKEPKIDGSTMGMNTVRAGLQQLYDTFKQIRQLKTILLFLLAYWLYIDGVNTIVRMAVDYGISIGFSSKDLILALLVTQFVGFPSTVAFGYLGVRMGTKRAILAAIAVYLAISIWAAFMHSRSEFYILAAAIGLVQGGLQALSRSYYAGIIPYNKSAEFFGFYNMLGKFAAVLGPVSLGLVALIVRHAGYSNNIASRTSIASVSLFFIAGGLLFYFVDNEATPEKTGNGTSKPFH